MLKKYVLQLNEQFLNSISKFSVKKNIELKRTIVEDKEKKVEFKEQFFSLKEKF